METETDPLLTIDEGGLCNRCAAWETQWAAKVELEKHYDEIMQHIRSVRVGRELTTGVDQKYDVVLGMSGGADSSWVYHLAKTAGLKVHPIHFDNGYDLPVSVHNVKCLVDHWGDKLEVIQVNGSEFYGLQRAFLQSGTTGLEIPTDHAIKAVTYQVARDLGVPVILNGTNMATESHGSPAWTNGHADWKYINGVAERFGVALTTFPHYSMWEKMTWMRGFEWISLLEYTNYVRADAIAEMGKLYGYQPYGFKHMESRITRFLHGYIIPRRFGWDTRRSRLSAMICSGQMSREEAFHILSNPAYDPEEMELDKLILCKNLQIEVSQFETLMKLPLKHYEDYPNYRNDPMMRALMAIYRRVR